MKDLIKGFLKKLGYKISKIEEGNSTSSQQIVKKLFSADSEITVFDVGAHKGESATFYKSTYKNSNIYSFEPFPNSFELLKTLNLTNFKPVKLGLSDKKGLESFCTNKGSPTNSLLSLSQNAKETWGGIEGLTEVGVLDC